MFLPLLCVLLRLAVHRLSRHIIGNGVRKSSAWESWRTSWSLSRLSVKRSRSWRNCAAAFPGKYLLICLHAATTISAPQSFCCMVWKAATLIICLSGVTILQPILRHIGKHARWIFWSMSCRRRKSVSSPAQISLACCF